MTHPQEQNSTNKEGKKITAIHEFPWWGRYEHFANSRWSVWVLAFASFIDAWLFFVPPELFLSALTLARPKRWLLYTAIATMSTLAGAYVGYMIGALFFETAGNAIINLLGEESSIINEAKQLYAENAFVTLVLTGLSPIPFVPFVIAAGFFNINLLTFTIAVLVARVFRYGPIALLVAVFGQKGVVWVHAALQASGRAGVIALVAVVAISVIVLVHAFF